MSATVSVTLRPAVDADREFLIRVYGSTRDEELSQVGWSEGEREAFVRMQFDAQDTSYRAQNPHGTFDVIEVDGVPAGRLYVDRRPDEIRIVDIAVLPEFRGAGVGAMLIAGVQREAAASGRIVSMHVEIHNPAAALYAQLGFVAVSEAGIYRRIEWVP